MTPSDIQALAGQIKAEVGKAVIGQADTIDLLLTALFSGGHMLLEGPPGTAKTFLARCFAATLSLQYGRIQFTPDLMPGDVLGTNIFNFQTGEFSLTKGPIFSDVLLADEINRTPPKTQAALLEAMQERRVTIDGETLSLGAHFLVIATQNPIEQQGTYPLPEAQLDRFLVKINMQYPKLEDEKDILYRFRSDFKIQQREDVKPVFTADDVRTCQKLTEQVFIRDTLLDYIAEIVHDTRNNGDLFLGASPRASLAILKMAKATAALNGRAFVTPDDIQYVAYPVLNHRIILTPEREMEGYDTRDVVKDIIEKMEVPR